MLQLWSRPYDALLQQPSDPAATKEFAAAMMREYRLSFEGAGFNARGNVDTLYEELDKGKGWVDRRYLDELWVAGTKR